MVSFSGLERLYSRVGRDEPGSRVFHKGGLRESLAYLDKSGSFQREFCSNNVNYLLDAGVHSLALVFCQKTPEVSFALLYCIM